MTCAAKGTLPITITWYRDSQLVTGNKNYHVSVGTEKDRVWSRLSVTVRDCQVAGNYSCRANNSEGEDEENYELEIEGEELQL